MPTEKTESASKSKDAPELTLDLIERGKAREQFDADIRTGCRKLVNHVSAGGQKVSKARCVITMKVCIGYDKGQYSVVATHETKTPAPLPHNDWLALTETTGGTPTLTRGDYGGQDDEIPGQKFIRERDEE